QARGEPADRPADVYSLGATLYFVLARGAPFHGDGTELVARVGGGEAPDFTRIPDEVPAELVAIVMKALDGEASRRYADANELAADLRRFLAGQLVAAHRYTPRERIARWVRKHRWATLVGAIAVAVLAAGAVVSLRRIVAERDQARAARELAEDRSQ